MSNSIEEARLIALFRAVARAESRGFISITDVGTLYDYLDVVIDIDLLDSASEAEIIATLDGYIAGFSAYRLVTAGVSPADIAGSAPDQHIIEQTGVDPVTNEIRR